MIALMTEYSKEDRPMDVVVAAGEIDIGTMSVEEVIKDVKALKSWVMNQNTDNTCAFMGINMPPHDKNGLPQTAVMRQRCYSLNHRYMELNGTLLAPQWGAWGAKHGDSKNPDYKPKMGYWTKTLLVDERAQGSGSLAFADNR